MRQREFDLDFVLGLFCEKARNVTQDLLSGLVPGARSCQDYNAVDCSEVNVPKDGEFSQRYDSQGRLTKELKDLGHFIRDEGNDAAHDETPYTEPEAKQLYKYTEVFLTYVFTIPDMLSRVPST